MGNPSVQSFGLSWISKLQTVSIDRFRNIASTAKIFVVESDHSHMMSHVSQVPFNFELPGAWSSSQVHNPFHLGLAILSLRPEPAKVNWSRYPQDHIVGPGKPNDTNAGHSFALQNCLEPNLRRKAHTGPELDFNKVLDTARNATAKMIVRVILAERRNDGSNGFGIIPRQTFQLHRFACLGGRFPVQNLKGCHAFGLYWNGPHEAIWGCTKTWYHFTVNVPKSCCRFFTLIIFWAVNTLEVLQRQAKPKWKARSYYTIPSADTLASSIHIMRNQDVQCTVFQISLICNLPNHKFYQQFLSSIGGDAHRTWPFSRQQCEFDTHVEAAGTPMHHTAH